MVVIKTTLKYVKGHIDDNIRKNDDRMFGLKQILWLNLLFLLLTGSLISIGHCDESMVSLIPEKKNWPPKGINKRYDIIRDTGISSVGKERIGNNGGARKLKLKGQQEYVLLDIDTASLKGKMITGAVLHLCSSSPENAPLMRVGVSSVASLWKEGRFFWYLPQIGSSCFNQAFLKKSNWAYPGSSLLDVVFGKGHTRWKFAEASKPDAYGWQSVAIDSDVIAAKVAGLSEGFCIADEVGSEWRFKKGVFRHILFPNRYFYSSESYKKGPWFEIWTSGVDKIPPDSVDSLTFSNSGLPPGEVSVKWKTPIDRGGGKTLGFNVSYNSDGNVNKVPRYLVPMAKDNGEEVVMYLQDLGFKPGQKVTVTIEPIDTCGNIGAPYKHVIITAGEYNSLPKVESKEKKLNKLLKPLIVNGLNISIVDILDKIDPINGKSIPQKKQEYFNNNHLFNSERKRITLQSARNETIGFQMNLSGRAKNIRVECLFNDKALIKPNLYGFAYVSVTDSKNKKIRMLPDPLVPMKGLITIPSSLEDQRLINQKNHSLIVEIYVPHTITPGQKKGTLIISAGDEQIELTINLEVRNFTLPNKLSFIPEMNAYGVANPYIGYDYYRLAHEHRTCLNRLPYGWDGMPAFAPEMKSGSFNWKTWDEKVGPLLDGSAFAKLPRENEPVDIFYLPFNENWPVNMFKHYTPSYWADEAFSESYPVKLGQAFKDFAEHFQKKQWFDTNFQFYLNNKVTYRKKNRLSSAPWMFDEPVNTQDFWALRWYGLLWHQSLSLLPMGDLKMWYRADVSYSEFGRDLLWGSTDIEYLGGNNKQKTRMIKDRKRLHGQTYFAEYGSANKIVDSNLLGVIWCLSAWFRGANGVLPWQTIGIKDSWKTADQTALFYPHADGPYPSVRLKAFMIGQQLIEYLTMVSELYDIPREMIEEWFNSLVKDNGGKPDFILIWDMKTRLGKMISNKAPEYRRSWVNWERPVWNILSLPDLGYVKPAPFMESAKPDCARFSP